MTAYDLFDPDSSEFRKRHLTDIAFWKQYADEKFEFHDSFYKKSLRLVHEFRRRLAKIDGYKDIPFLKSFESSLNHDESEAERMLSIASTYTDLSKDLQSELEKQCTSEYEKEAIRYRKLEKLHSKTLKEVEMDKDKIKKTAFKMERLHTNNDKGEKYHHYKQILDELVARYHSNKDGELLIRAKIISKSEEIRKLWVEEETQRLEVLQEGWKVCQKAENCTNHAHGESGKSKAFKHIENIDIDEIVGKTSEMRMKLHRYKDYEDSEELIETTAEHLVPFGDKSQDKNSTPCVQELTGLNEHSDKTKWQSAKAIFKIKNKLSNCRVDPFSLPNDTDKNKKRRSRRINNEEDRCTILDDNEKTQVTGQTNDQIRSFRKDKSFSKSNQTLVKCISRKSDSRNNDNATKVICFDALDHKLDKSSNDESSWNDEVEELQLSHTESEFIRKSLRGKPLRGSSATDEFKENIRGSSNKNFHQKPQAHVVPVMKSTVNLDDTGSDSETSDSSDSDEIALVRNEKYSTQRQVKKEAVWSALRNADGLLVPTQTNAQDTMYFCAEEVLKLRQTPQRRLNTHIKLVAVRNYKSNKQDNTFSLKEGESVVMTSTPSDDGFAFGWKKIRLNMKRKYGLFPVEYVKIDTSNSQNLQKVLRRDK